MHVSFEYFRLSSTIQFFFCPKFFYQVQFDAHTHTFPVHTMRIHTHVRSYTRKEETRRLAFGARETCNTTECARVRVP
jgi:hypothetical protein